MEFIAIWLSTHIGLTTMVAYFVGIITAGAFARYMIAVARRHAEAAAGWDFVIMFFATVVTMTLWAQTGDSIWVLLGYILGNTTGTYFTTKFSKKDSNGK